MPPDPLTPADCDLRGLPFMPLDTARLLDSDLFALATGDEFKAAIALWCKSWQQVPAASLPDDDRVLAHLSGTGTRWKKVKAMALRHFVLCSDGRWYHPVVAEKALEAWKHRLKQREKANRRWANAADGEKTDTGKPAASADGIPAGDAAASAPAMQGTVKGQGQLYSDPNGSGGDAPPQDADQVFWTNAKAYLKPHTKGDPGQLVGKWCRDFGKGAAASAISAAQVERPATPIPFIEATLRKRGNGHVGDDLELPIA